MSKGDWLKGKSQKYWDKYKAEHNTGLVYSNDNKKDISIDSLTGNSKASEKEVLRNQVLANLQKHTFEFQENIIKTYFGVENSQRLSLGMPEVIPNKKVFIYVKNEYALFVPIRKKLVVSTGFLQCSEEVKMYLLTREIYYSRLPVIRILKNWASILSIGFISSIASFLIPFKIGLGIITSFVFGGLGLLMGSWSRWYFKMKTQNRELEKQVDQKYDGVLDLKTIKEELKKI